VKKKYSELVRVCKKTVGSSLVKKTSWSTLISLRAIHLAQV